MVLVYFLSFHFVLPDTQSNVNLTTDSFNLRAEEETCEIVSTFWF